MAPIEVRGHLYSLSRPSLYEARRIIIDTFSAMAPKRLIINHGASDPIHSLQSSRSLHSTYSLPGVSAFTSRMMNAVARSFFCWSAVATFLCPAGGMNSQQLTMAIPSPRAPVGGSYLLGLGIADVTGPVVETNMFGYASLDQNDAGIHMRQRSRAYIIADSADPTQRVVFVNSDISSGDTAVRKGILDRLQQLYPGVYTESNFALAGTHSHAGVGGYVNNLLPQLTSLGFVRQTYDAIVNGTVLSIVRAHESLAPGTLSIGNTTVIDGAINRSPFSYLQNPLEERNRYPGDLEKELSLLKFTDSATGVDRGFLSFFAVHGTSLYMNNTLVSTDNKGMAAYLYESFMEPYALPGKNKFVAGFAQSTSGDVSPNTLGAFCESPGKPWHGQPCDFEKSTCGNRTQDCRGRGPGYQTSDFLSNEIIGRKQFDAARILMEYSDDALAPINGPVKSFHTYVDIGNYQFTLKNGKPAKTCKAALGFSFAGGTTDGPGAFDFIQGINSTDPRNPLWDVVKLAVTPAPSEEQKACHYPKPILLNVGFASFPYQWSPSIVDIQAFRIGQLVILVLPSEFTTMAGRRLREAVRGKLIADGIIGQDAYVIAVGPANVYSHYTTTYEEYLIQRYEGASTMYGPHQLEAYIDIYTKHLQYLSKDSTAFPPSGPAPDDLSSKAWSLQSKVIMDSSPAGHPFGDVLTNVKTTTPYKKGETVTAVFQAANPRNNLRLEGTFLAVEKLTDGNKWETVRTDSHPSTKLVWTRTNTILGYSEVKINWTIEDSTPPGQYRITYFGDSKAFFSRAITPFQGSTSTFTVA